MSGGIRIKQKNIFIVSLGLIFALLISGCQIGPGGNPSPENSSPNSIPEEIIPSAPPPQSLRIAVCTSPNAIDDSSRNEACFEGALSFVKSRGEVDSLTPLQESSGDSATALRSFREIAPTFDVMIFVGPTFSQLSSIALENPNRYYILVDAPLTDDTGKEIQISNVHTIQFADQECGFFAGVSAALETQTNRIAIINDIVSPASLRYYYGFRSGVAYANGNYDLAAEVIDLPAYTGSAADGSLQQGNFVGRINDPTTGYTLAESLIAEGCDVIFSAAGSSNSGIYAAAKEHQNIKLIGSETDQFSQGGYDNGNVILTSVTKAFSEYIERQLTAIVDGNFQYGSSTLSAKDNATGYVSSPDCQQLSAKTLQVLSDIYPLMQDGTIVPLSGPQ